MLIVNISWIMLQNISSLMKPVISSCIYHHFV